jgi:hypothetical protein
MTIEGKEVVRRDVISALNLFIIWGAVVVEKPYTYLHSQNKCSNPFYSVSVA